MLRISIIVCILQFINGLVFSQITNNETYGIKRPKSLKQCQAMMQKRKMMPEDIRFMVIKEDQSLALYINDAAWLDIIFDSKSDGFALDIVSKELYSCDNKISTKTNWLQKGYLLPPVYKSEFKNLKDYNLNGDGLIRYHKLPEQFKSEEVEANIVFLNNRYFCGYQSTIDIEMQGWDLLKTGLYMDSLTQEEMTEQYKDLSKILRFTIQFEKNNSEFNADQIKPLYDSLNLSDYNIKEIHIQAYTSVEGSYERNEQLQNKRAKSIVKALESYQSESIRSTVKANENWVEFLEDISESPYKNMLSMSKEEIKNQLSSKSILEKLEPILKQHRKAAIELHLEKRVSLLKNTPSELKTYFDQLIAQQNINEALYLQQLLFYKVGKNELPDNFIHTLEIPESAEFGRLLINQTAFEYEQGGYNTFEALNNFEKLLKIIPDNNKIQYNICVLKLNAWTQSSSHFDYASLKKEIEALRKKGIHENLVKRLLINYHIILSEIHYQNRNFTEKNKSVKFIYDTYKALKLSDADLVNMAKYFATYSKFDWGISALSSRAKAIDASEDLLFYYISLTIAYPKYTNTTSYRTILLNAINHNRVRFCDLFNTMGYGGISFQLLSDKNLKKNYCENCVE